MTYVLIMYLLHKSRETIVLQITMDFFYELVIELGLDWLVLPSDESALLMGLD